MYAIFLLIAIIGGLCTAWLASQLITGLRSLDWPSVVGEIILKDVPDEVRKNPRYHNRYVYRYNVRGVDYFSQRVSVSDRFISRARLVRQILDQYPDGAMMTVYYQRQNPQLAVLERGPRIQTVMGFLISVLILAVGIYGLTAIS